MSKDNLGILLKRRYNLSIYIVKTIVFIFLGAAFLFGCTESISDGLLGNHFHTSANWVGGDTEHDENFTIDAENCKACHGKDLSGGQSGVSCLDCHHKWELNGIVKDHGEGFVNEARVCKGCHGDDLKGGLIGVSCVTCHHNWGVPSDPEHGTNFTENPTFCKACHGIDLKGGIVKYSCFSCHHEKDASGWTQKHGAQSKEAPDKCNGCHGNDINNSPVNLSCKSCHHDDWSSDTEEHPVAFSANSDNCKLCHGEKLDHNVGILQRSCVSCHHEWGEPSDPRHGTNFTENPTVCKSCHGSDLRGGLVSISCYNTCHHHGAGYVPESHPGMACTRCHNDFSQTLIASDCDNCHGGSLGGDGKGSTTSHDTHTAGSNKGPNPQLACDDCHDTSNYPTFKEGGGTTLNDTTVCDPCHSPNGVYDGVNDPIIGAKTNWSNGVYTGDALKSGKEKWCVTCHDDSPSVIKTKTAPNIAGNESETFTYGTGYGYYKTGHGLENTAAYPDSGGVKFGAGISCDDCHDFALPHIDGIERTFDCTDDCDSDEYKTSYRLDEILGADPMEIPRLTDAVRIKDSSFALCFNCHNSAKIKDSENLTSNFRSDGYATPNLHYYHLDQYLPYRYRADWDPIVLDPDNRNSRMTCVSCHNVHGTTNLAMMRDGRLTGAAQGLQIYYDYNVMASPPNNVTLLDSTGYTWRKASVYEFCIGCHGGNPWVSVDRTPYWTLETPVLSWTLETNYTTRGVYPNNIGNGLPVEFRVNYTDKQDNAPSEIEVWIDLNDDSDYGDPGEKTAMTEVDGGDIDYTDGKLYTSTQTINYPVTATDGMINYRFFATDGINTGIGAAAEDNIIRIDQNNAHDVPSEYITIQTAIDDTDNDGMTTVLVADGTYIESINFGGRAITVKSVNGNAVTVLDGNGTGTVVTFNSGEDSGSVLDGFTIQNGGSVNYGAGIYMTSASPVIQNCNISNNNSNAHGSGIYLTGSSPTIDNCVFSNNTATFDGTIHVISLSTPTISNCTFTNNTVRWGGGIGINSAGAGVILTNLTMSGNNAGRGGGLYISNSTVNITDLNASSNTTTLGGGLYITDNSIVTIDGTSSISNNTSTFDGGGIYNITNSTVNLTGCIINSNSGRWGGGIHNNGSDLNITGASIINNDASQGGGMRSIGSSTITIINTLIAGNTAARNSACEGGGIAIESTTLNIMNSTIADNNSWRNGSAIDVNASNSITITNTIFDGNFANATGDEIQGAESTLNMDYSIYSTTLNSVGTNNIGPNMVSTPPTFVDAASGDYYLLFGSSGIDTGTNSGAPGDDIVGTSRSLDGDNSGAITGDGSDYDMGAYEYIYLP